MHQTNTKSDRLGQSDRSTSKARDTQQRILSAAAELFGSKGFDGTGLRQIEEASGVNRGLVAYHFGNKEDLWKAVVDSYFSEYLTEMESQQEVLGTLDTQSKAKVAIRRFVHFSVRHRNLSRIMIQENLNSTWRQDWIIDRYLLPIQRMESGLSDDASLQDEVDPAARYALIGACIMPFLTATEVQKMHGIDVFEDAFVQRHIDLLIEAFTSNDFHSRLGNPTRRSTLAKKRKRF